ncbi:hypothetical protein [Homoserinimonas sp. OAct 916]|uniref:hypothetical protein n=1 Tax=Homoserinimonas sp. OAct 916 TaxID=2211450 RepID=UPI0013008FDC|nr:hypothetical protein [Homoserinimonas sp. OAct 916]
MRTRPDTDFRSAPLALSSSRPAPIGAPVENQLEHVLWQLVRGEVELYECTPALAALWHVAHATGHASRQAEIDRLKTENDRLYLRAYNSPAQVAEIIQRRLDGHFEREAARFFEGVAA